MCYFVFLFLLLGQLAASEQHQIVWGQYVPPQVTACEVASALKSNQPVELKAIGGGYSGGHLYSMHLDNTDYIIRRTGGVYGPVGIPQEVAIVEEASLAGICPKLYYANAATGLMIMEKIDNILPSEFSPRLLTATPEILAQMAAHLRAIKKLNPDSGIVTNRFDSVFFKTAVDSIDKELLPATERKTIEEILSWPIDTAQKVVTHNDLHGRNLLYDGKKLYIIDWEMAGWGPPDHDVACFCNFQTMTYEEGMAFYTLYLERKATNDEAKRFHRLRIMHAATCGMHGFSHCKPGATDPMAHLRSESAIDTLRNVLFYLDRGKVDLRDDNALQACGLSWLQFATYLLRQQ